MFGIAAFAQAPFSSIPANSPAALITGVFGTGLTGNVNGGQITVVLLDGIQATAILNNGANNTAHPYLWSIINTSQN